MRKSPSGPTLLQIKASAGSGKTYTLTRGFISLLKGSLEVSPFPCADQKKRPPSGSAFAEIIAATFTNRAAAEMKTRVMQELKRIALQDNTSAADELLSGPEAASWVDSIIRHYDSFNIRTIDSLLTMLVRLSAMELGLAPDFEPDFAHQAFLAPLYDAYLQEALREGSPARTNLRKVCLAVIAGDRKGFSAGQPLREEIIGILDFFLEHDAHGGPLPCLDEGLIRSMFEKRAAALKKDSEHLGAVLSEEKLAPQKFFSGFLLKCRENPREIFKSETPKSIFDSSMKKCLLAACHGNISARALSAFQEFQNSLLAWRHEGQALHKAMRLAPLGLVAVDLLEKAENLQRTLRKIPGGQIPLLAVKALRGQGGVSEAYCRMGSRLTHLLIDEFQDTSRIQWEAVKPLAVECLARGGSLRYVGDVKQAIYNWRGGDSALFDELAADPDLTAIAGEASRDELEYNRRSAGAVISHNNEFFGRFSDGGPGGLAAEVLETIMPERTPEHLLVEGSERLAGTFAKSAQKIPEGKNPAEGLVRLYRISQPDGNELEQAVRERLQDLFSGFHAYNPGDIAVLVRSNDEAAEISSCLLEWGWPVLTENSFHLAEHPLIKRLVALLTFLDYPLDDLAFWEFVSGPECFAGSSEISGVSGLETEALDDWLASVRFQAGEKQSHAGKPLFMLFQEYFPREWRVWLEPFYSQAGLMSAYDTLSEIYRRYRLLERKPEQAVFLRRLLEVAHLAECRGYSSLAGFLNFWREFGGEEKAPMPEKVDAVRVMTIHKAKGLEFPVVVLPFHNFSGTSDKGVTITEIDGVSILTAQGRHLGDEYYRRKLDQALEQINLLYVAWTRPSKELHAFVSTRESRMDSFSKAMLLMLDGYNLEEDGDVYSLGASAGPERQAPQRAKRVERATGVFLPPSSTDWRPMNWLPRLRIKSAALEVFEAEPEDNPERKAERGIFLHRCFEALAFLPSEALRPEALPGLADKRINSLAEAFFPQNRDVSRKMANEALEAVTWFLRLPEAALWLERGQAEQSLLDEDGKVLRVDLLVDLAEDGFTLLDYKSGLPAPDYAAKMRRYRKALWGATQKPVRCLLVYCDERRVEEV